jgi:hypothetical protein
MFSLDGNGSTLQQSLLLQTVALILHHCQNSSEMNQCKLVLLQRRWRDGTHLLKAVHQSGCWTGKNCDCIKDLPSFLSMASVLFHSFNMLPRTRTWAQHIDRTNRCLRIYHHNSLVSCPYYIIAYFQEQQPDPPGAWYRSDTELILTCLSLAHTQIVNMSNSSSKAQALFSPICNIYNRPVSACKTGDNCPDQHVCKICHKKEHRAPDCPRASAT